MSRLLQFDLTRHTPFGGAFVARHADIGDGVVLVGKAALDHRRHARTIPTKAIASAKQHQF